MGQARSQASYVNFLKTLAITCGIGRVALFHGQGYQRSEGTDTQGHAAGKCHSLHLAAKPRPLSCISSPRDVTQDTSASGQPKWPPSVKDQRRLPPPFTTCSLECMSAPQKWNSQHQFSSKGLRTSFICNTRCTTKF